jgi:hypothetical protein
MIPTRILELLESNIIHTTGSSNTTREITLREITWYYFTFPRNVP